MILNWNIRQKEQAIDDARILGSFFDKLLDGLNRSETWL